MRFMSRLAAIVAAASIVASPAAAQKLGGIQAATTVNATDKIPVSQNGVTAAITPVQLASYLAPTFQASDADLTAIAALSTTPFGRSLLTMADAPSTRAAIGVSATGADTTYLYRSNNLSDLGSVSAARSNLGLVIGTTIETWSANLDALAALTGTNTIYYRSGSNTWSPVVLGPNLAFSGGNLTIPGLPIALSGDATGSTSALSGALALTLATVNSTPGSYGGALTIPTFTVDGKGRLTASGSVALGTVPIGQGGTGSTTASGARSALGAAASGPNSDITALSGLTTALSVAQGGTAGTTAATARSGIGAAASGANTDITSITGSAATLTNGRTFAFTGDITCTTAAFNGSANISTPCALANTSTARADLGLGSAATANVGTTGSVVPLLSGANTWSGAQTFGTVVLANAFRSSASSVTLAATDAGGSIYLNNTASSVTIPTYANVPIAAGSRVVIFQWCSGSIAVTRSSGVSLYYFNGTGTPPNADRSIAIGGWTTLVKLDNADTWAIVGGQGVS